MPSRLAAPILAVLATLVLCACAVEGDIANTPTLYVDEVVNRAWLPEIYIEPETAPMQPLTAVLFPLRLRQQFSNGTQLSEELTRAFWNVWLRDRVFPGLAFAQGETWRGPDKAMSLTTGSGTDLIIGGEITHIMFGGTSGTTEISLRLEIYDAATGNLLWSMAHAGQMRNALNGDFIVLTKKSRLPSSPAGAIMVALAEDMAKPVKRWNFGQPEEDENAPSPLK